MNIETLIIIGLGIATIFFVSLTIYSQMKYQKIKEKYEDIIDIEAYKEKISKIIIKQENKLQSIQNKEREVEKNIAIYDYELGFYELGIYKNVYDFDTSEEFKRELEYYQTLQKDMLKNKDAIYCKKELVIGNSKREGKKMANRIIKLTTKAFNNECSFAISNAKWNNINQMIKRIEKNFDDINKLNETQGVVISKRYLDLKLKELRITHEYKLKKQEEKEEEKEINRRIREEQKFEAEAKKANDEEVKYQKLLEKAMKEAEKHKDDMTESFQNEIDELNRMLEEAKEKNERAKSMAQQTKAGHVYVISNIGSFGENVYKIGMTRRLEPEDRVKELGNASVPFTFDIHAMIHSDNAPELENQLHKRLEDKRVNLINARKEFFRTDIKEIETIAKEINPKVEFYINPEAKEFRESELLKRI
jgi:hypothetical protein